jgi:hypothetical protein
LTETDAVRELSISELDDVVGGGSYPNLGNLGDGDIMAIAFIVMMEATKSAQEDLKSIMDGVRNINHNKAHLRIR